MTNSEEFRIGQLSGKRTAADWQDRYQALEEARQLPAAARSEVARAFLRDENSWVKSLAEQLLSSPGAPSRRSRRGIVREVDQILHGAQLTFDQRWRLIKLFEEAEESGSTAQLGLAVDRASRLVTAALSERARSQDYLKQLDSFLRHVAMYVRPVPVGRELKDLASATRGALEAFGVQAQTDLPEGIHIPAAAFDRALRELVQNAVDAGSDHIEVAGHAQNGQVIIRVGNNGQPLRREDVDPLFRPWFTTRAGHAGLGLYLARAALSEVGGSISLTQASPVAFDIALPR